MLVFRKFCARSKLMISLRDVYGRYCYLFVSIWFDKHRWIGNVVFEIGTVLEIFSLGKHKSNLGWSPLHLAAYFGHKNVVEELLKVRSG